METFIGIILGGSFLAFLEFLIRRYDTKHDRLAGVIDQIKALGDRIDKIDAKADEREAVNKRVRILRFADEMREDRRHSKDSFDQVLSDITGYDQYCTSHPEFRNNQTTVTADYIKKAYAERLEKHDFA